MQSLPQSNSCTINTRLQVEKYARFPFLFYFLLPILYFLSIKINNVLGVAVYEEDSKEKDPRMIEVPL